MGAKRTQTETLFVLLTAVSLIGFMMLGYLSEAIAYSVNGFDNVVDSNAVQWVGRLSIFTEVMITATIVVPLASLGIAKLKKPSLWRPQSNAA